jgi:hypothetical protein
MDLLVWLTGKERTFSIIIAIFYRRFWSLNIFYFNIYCEDFWFLFILLLLNFFRFFELHSILKFWILMILYFIFLNWAFIPFMMYYSYVIIPFSYFRILLFYDYDSYHYFVLFIVNRYFLKIFFFLHLCFKHV